MVVLYENGCIREIMSLLAMLLYILMSKQKETVVTEIVWNKILERMMAGNFHADKIFI